MSTDPGFERAKKLYKKPLSDNMLNDEKYRVYEPYGFFPDANRVPVLALTRCQGYIFNQDLFATPYQQLRSRALEQKMRSFSYSRESTKSRSSLMSSTLRSFVKQRRHTSYDPRARVGSIFADELDAMDIDGGEVMEDDDEIGESQESRLEEDGDEGDMDDDDGDEGDLDEEEEEEDEDVDDEDDEDEDDDYAMHYGGYGGYLLLNAYKVKVVEIVVDPNDTSYLPTETSET